MPGGRTVANRRAVAQRLGQRLTDFQRLPCGPCDVCQGPGEFVAETGVGFEGGGEGGGKMRQGILDIRVGAHGEQVRMSAVTGSEVRAGCCAAGSGVGGSGTIFFIWATPEGRGPTSIATKRWVAAVRRLVDRTSGLRRTRRRPAHSRHDMNQWEMPLESMDTCTPEVHPGYQTRSLNFSDRRRLGTDFHGRNG